MHDAGRGRGRRKSEPTRAERLPGGVGSVATSRGGGGGANDAGQRALGGERCRDASGPVEAEGGVREIAKKKRSVGSASRAALAGAAVAP